MPALADCGYEDAGHRILTPGKKPTGVKELDINTRTRNMLLSPASCLCERGFALLSQRWKTIQNITARRSEIGPIARAVLVLTQADRVKVLRKVAVTSPGIASGQTARTCD
jgi:hypothetical protein